jgi:hypothetical protein
LLLNFSATAAAAAVFIEFMVDYVGYLTDDYIKACGK